MVFALEKTASIYSERRNVYPTIQSLADELRTVEDLMHMGYAKINGVLLSDRLKDLEKEIALRDKRRKK